VRALHRAAWFAQQQGDTRAWTENAETCLALARELDDDRSAGRALRSLATAASLAGDLERAEELFKRSVELSSSAGYNWNLVLVTHNLGDNARAVGDFPRAVELLERSVSLARRGDDLRSVSHFLTDLGQAEFSAGDHAGAEAHIKEGIGAARELRSPQRMASGVEALAVVYAATSRPLEAATLLAAAIKGAQVASQRELDLAQRELREAAEATIAAELDPSAREVALETGRAMSLDEAVEYALQVVA
jgi:tetratricopeptide (TPR) repeat protein